MRWNRLTSSQSGCFLTFNQLMSCAPSVASFRPCSRPRSLLCGRKWLGVTHIWEAWFSPNCLCGNKETDRSATDGGWVAAGLFVNDLPHIQQHASFSTCLGLMVRCSSGGPPFVSIWAASPPSPLARAHCKNASGRPLFAPSAPCPISAS